VVRKEFLSSFEKDHLLIKSLEREASLLVEGLLNERTG